MNERQKKWLTTMANTLDNYIDQKIVNEPLEKNLDIAWGNVAGFIAVVVAVCKGHEDEAYHILFDVADKER